jgi:hypothetical protein
MKNTLKTQETGATKEETISDPKRGGQYETRSTPACALRSEMQRGHPRDRKLSLGYWKSPPYVKAVILPSLPARTCMVFEAFSEDTAVRERVLTSADATE